MQFGSILIVLLQFPAYEPHITLLVQNYCTVDNLLSGVLLLCQHS